MSEISELDQNINKMEFNLNCSPHLYSGDITKRLLNRKFHSDLQFTVDDKIIYAHSLELIKRSVVFAERLKGMFGQKLIPVVDFKYETFFQFIRFIYTDECDITEENAIDLLKLATQYKIVMLENKVINCVFLNYSKDFLMRLFEFCILDKYELIRNTITSQVIHSLGRCLNSNHFATLHHDTVDAVLQFDRIPSGVTEAHIFTAVCNWITAYSQNHNISVSEGREHWDKLVRKIRFPTMTYKTISDCCKKFPNLMSKLDCMSIAEQIVFGPSDTENPLWINKRRGEFVWPYEYGTFSRDNKFETRLAVTNDVYLCGIRIGANATICEKIIELEIIRNDSETKTIELAGFMFWDLTINLGDLLHLKSKSTYKIMIKYLDVPHPTMQVLRRKVGVDVIINGASKSVRVMEISRNVFELFFKLPTD